MKKFLNLFVMSLCVTGSLAFADDNDINKTSSEIEKELLASDPSFYNDNENREVYDFLAAEIAEKRENWDGAKKDFDQFLEQKRHPKVLERRIQLDLEEGNIAEALPFIQKLVIQDPTNLQTYNLLAEAYVLMDDIEYAAKTYHHLVEMVYLTNQGVVEYSPYLAILKRFHEFELPLEKQLEIFKQLAALENQDTFPLVILAGFLIDNSRYSEAESYLERALQINPANPKIYTLYTYVYWNIGAPEKAIAILEHAYAQYPDPEIGFELANALISNFEYEEAYQLLVRLMIMTDELPVVFERFIGMAYAMGNYDNIRDMLMLRLSEPEQLTNAVLNLFYFSEILGNSEKLLEVLPVIENPVPQYAEAILTIQAKIALSEKNYSAFDELFEQIKALDIYNDAGIALKKMMMLQEAKEFVRLDREIALSGQFLAQEQSAHLAFLKAMSAYGHGDYETMQNVFEAEIKANPQDAIAYNALGFSLLEVDPANALVALPYISKANLLLPNQDFIEDSLAWAYFHLNDLLRAKKYIEKAYQKNKDPEIIAHYIVILDALGEVDKAKSLYHKFNLFFGNSEKKQILKENIEWIE
ncbi:tetratricopeptide repeat protein [Ignatzschineria sp. LJL83]